MNPDNPEEFAQRHAALHTALQRSLRPQPLSVQFQTQVRARIAAAPEESLPTLRSKLRWQFALKLANTVAAGVATAAVCWAAWPWLGSLAEQSTVLMDSASFFLWSGALAMGALIAGLGKAHLLKGL